MDEQHAKGTAKDIEGRTKEAAGAATDNDQLRAEGQADQAEGGFRKAVGDIKDSVRDMFKKDKSQ